MLYSSLILVLSATLLADVSNDISSISLDVKGYNSTYPTTCNTLGYAEVSILSPNGKIIYVASGNSGVQIIDISKPNNPIKITTYNTNSYAWDVDISKNGKRLYIATVIQV